MSPSVTESYLEQLHALLLELSPAEDADGGSPPPSPSRALGDATHLSASIQLFESDFAALSDFLFETMRQQFGRLVPPSRAPELLEEFKEISPKGFLLLLRCCMLVLRLLEFNPKLVAEKIDILVGMLRELCVLAQSLLSVGPDGRNGNAEGAKVPLIAFFASVMEVFINGLLMHRQLRSSFSTDYLSSATQKSCGEADGHSLEEIINIHFLLSTHDDRMVSRYIESLSRAEPVNDVPELSLNAALRLLGMCGASSVPHMLQAHIMLSVSRCINIPKDSLRCTDELKNSCILTFGQSVNLYVSCVSKLDFFKKSIECEDQPYCFVSLVSVDSFIKPVVCSECPPHTDVILDLCHLNCLDILSGSKADVFGNSVAYIRENQKILDGQCRDQSVLILKYIISSVLVEEIGEITKCEARNVSQHETFYLLSVLKLMGSSLLQIIWNLRQKGNTTSKEMVVSEILRCFQKFEENQFMKRIFLCIAGSHPFKCKETMLMIAHFASLLLYSFSRRLGLLWKSCILMIMTVLNLLFLEKTNFDIMPSPGTVPAGTQEDTATVPAPRTSSVMIASNIQDIQKLYLQEDALSIDCKTKRPARVVGGESFIHILPCYQKNPSGWDDDLIDFIGCTPGKDYSKWLKDLKAFKKSHYRNVTRKILSRARSNTAKAGCSRANSDKLCQKLRFKRTHQRWNL